MKIIKLLLSLSLMTSFYSCNNNLDKEPVKEQPSSKMVTKDINPTLETNDSILEEIEKLQDDGKVKDVIVRESFPVQITLTGPEDVLKKLIEKAKGDSNTDSNSKMVTKDINPTLETNDSILEEIEKLQDDGKVKDVIVRESFPVQITLTGPEDVLKKLIEKAKGEDKPSIKKVLFINSQLVDCEGVAPQKCMETREDETKNWNLFYDSISGFEFEEGYKYEIEIEETKIDNPPADSSSIKRTLLKVINKEKV